MFHEQKNGDFWMRKLIFLLLILSMFSTAADAVTQRFNFTMQNDTGLNFENGSYIVEVIELTRPVFVKVNMTNNDKSVVRNLYDSEAPITFNQIMLGASFITETSAMVTIEFPSEWSAPKQYQIIHPVVPVGIPNIVLTKSVDKTNINIGDVVKFNIKLENNGNATAYNMTLIEPLMSGFSKDPYSTFPPEINAELAAGDSEELNYGLKAVDSGTFSSEPTIVKYGSKTSKSNPITITVATTTQEKSKLTTVISLDKKNVTVGGLIKATVKITNIGKAPAKSVLVEGTPPMGMEVIEGDLRQVYDNIPPMESKEYRVGLKATETGNYSIYLRTTYNDDGIGTPSDSEPIIVTQNERNYLYIFIPIIIIIAGVVLFTIKRHKEYSY